MIRAFWAALLLIAVHTVASAQPPKLAPATINSPAYGREGATQAKKGSQATQKALPPVTVEKPPIEESQPTQSAQQARQNQDNCPDCDRDDLIQQRRMAVAAERQVDISILAVVFTIIGTLASAAAAWAAAAAARNAGDAVKQTERLERPWLVVKSYGAIRSYDPATFASSIMVNPILTNVGRGPAILDGCTIKFVEFSKLPTTPDYSGLMRLHMDRTVVAGGEARGTSEDWPSTPIEADAHTRWVAFGVITYRGMNDAIHRTGYAVELLPTSFEEATPVGGAVYNYTN